MFKRVISQPGFWRSVVSLGTAFAILFVIIKWILDGFKFVFFTENNLPLIVAGLAAAGFFYGFFVTYGKFWKQLKEKDS